LEDTPTFNPMMFYTKLFKTEPDKKKYLIDHHCMAAYSKAVNRLSVMVWLAVFLSLQCPFKSSPTGMIG